MHPARNRLYQCRCARTFAARRRARQPGSRRAPDGWTRPHGPRLLLGGGRAVHEPAAARRLSCGAVDHAVRGGCLPRGGTADAASSGYQMGERRAIGRQKGVRHPVRGGLERRAAARHGRWHRYQPEPAQLSARACLYRALAVSQGRRALHARPAMRRRLS